MTEDANTAGDVARRMINQATQEQDLRGTDAIGVLLALALLDVADAIRSHE